MAAVSVAPPASRVALTVAVGAPHRPCSLLADPTASVGDLAVGLGLERGTAIWIDGCRYDTAARLDHTGIATGSRVDIRWPRSSRWLWWSGGPGRGADGGRWPDGRQGDDHVPDRHARRPAVAMRCVAGPSSGMCWALGPGEHVLGRGGSSTLRIDDPDIEPHALLVDVDAEGIVTVVQLTGRLPATVGSVPLRDAAVVGPREPLFIGASRLEFRAVDLPPGPDAQPGGRGTEAPVPVVGVDGPEARVDTTSPAGPWARTWRRVPRVLTHPAEQPRPGPGSIDEQRRVFLAEHRRRAPTLDGAIDTVVNRRPALWTRRPHDGDAYTVTLGLGPLEWTPRDAKRSKRGRWRDVAETLPDQPVAIDLGPGASVAVVGDGAAIGRSLVTQLAANAGPADWSLVVVADDPERWAWSRWLPHLDERRPPIHGLRHDRHLVVVTDGIEMLSSPESTVRAVLDRHPSAALIAISPTPPSRCRTVVTVGARGRGTWTPDIRAVPPRPVHLSGLAVTTALDAARRLAPLVDPDVAAMDAVHVDHVSLAELVAQGPAASDGRSLHARWQRNDHGRALVAPLGVTLDGIVDVDLVADGPHTAILGRTTESGAGPASEVLRSLVVGLAARYPPDRLNLVLADGPDHATFDAAVVLSHVIEHLDRVDDDRAERLVATLAAEIRRRRERLAAAGVADLVAYDALEDADGRHLPVMPRLVLAIDATITGHSDIGRPPGLDGRADELVARLCDVAGEAGPLGVHLVLGVASVGVTSGAHAPAVGAATVQIMTDCADPDSSGRRPAAGKPPSTGAPLAVVHVAGRDPTTCWLARCTRPDAGGLHTPVESVATVAARPAGDEASELDVFVRTICRLSERSGYGTAPPRWLDPLPDALPREGFDGTSVPPGAIGLVDVPDEGRREPLRWKPDDGSIALVGDAGSGTSSTVSALLSEWATADGAAASTRCWILDGDDDRRLIDAHHLHDGPRVARVGADEARGDGSGAAAARVLHALRRELWRRRHRTPPRPARQAPPRPILLAVDGVHRWAGRPAAGPTSEPDTPERCCDVLAQLARHGPAVGITVVAAGRPSPEMAAVAGGCDVCLLFSVDPSTDVAALLDIDIDDVEIRTAPRHRPGRCRDLATGRIGQVVVPSSGSPPRR